MRLNISGRIATQPKVELGTLGMKLQERVRHDAERTARRDAQRALRDQRLREAANRAAEYDGTPPEA